MTEPTSAFPYVYEYRGTTTINPGMTLRDYFAAAALQGLLTTVPQRSSSVKDKQLAIEAYELANAMMQQRSISIEPPQHCKVCEGKGGCSNMTA